MYAGHQASTKTHNYSHHLCMFLSTGFRNLGELNTDSDVGLSKENISEAGGPIFINFT